MKINPLTRWLVPFQLILFNPLNGFKFLIGLNLLIWPSAYALQSTSDLSRSILSRATAGSHVSESYLKSWMDRAIPQIKKFSPHELIQAVWALALADASETPSPQEVMDAQGIEFEAEHWVSKPFIVEAFKLLAKSSPKLESRDIHRLLLVQKYSLLCKKTPVKLSAPEIALLESDTKKREKEETWPTHLYLMISEEIQESFDGQDLIEDYFEPVTATHVDMAIPSRHLIIQFDSDTRYLYPNPAHSQHTSAKEFRLKPEFVLLQKIWEAAGWKVIRLHDQDWQKALETYSSKKRSDIYSDLLGQGSTFCEKANRVGLQCQEKDFLKAEKLIPFIKESYRVVRPKSIQGGLALYLNDRTLRRIPINRKELDGLFAPLFGKKGHLMKLPKSVSPQENSFFIKILNQSGMKLTGNLKGYFSGMVPSSPGAALIESAQGSWFFKRNPSNHLGLVGKKIASEVAAYRLSELMGFELIPETVIATYDKKLGSAQRAVDQSFTLGAEIKNPRELIQDEHFWDSVSELNVLDYLGSFQDRHSSNLFFDLKKYLIQAIDHETGFNLVIPRHFTYPDYLSGGTIPKNLTARTRVRLANLTFNEVKTTFKDLLTSDQIEAVWLRVQILRAYLILRYGQLLP